MSNLRAALVTALNKIETEKQMQIDELKADINEWAKEDTQEPDVKSHGFKPTNNVSRETFNAVRDNPNKTNGELVKLLDDRGFKASSVTSLLGQMVKQRLVVRDEEGKYFTPYTEYTPIKSTKTKAKTKTKKKKVTITKRPYVKSGKYATPPTQSGIAALDTHTTLPTPVATAAPAFDPDKLLSTLSFPQVLALYKKIKTLLGEAS
jgi:hypothetical protein